MLMLTLLLFADQINICWATPENPIANVTQDKMNETFSSLSSARPSATEYSFDLQALYATSTSTSSSASASATTSGAAGSAAQSQSASSTASPSPSSSSSSGLSGGAIAGIVIGAIAVIALIGIGAFILFRRNRKNARAAELDGKAHPQNAYQAAQEKNGQHFRQAGYSPAPQQEPVEMHQEPATAEMPASQRPFEMEGSGPAGHSWR